MAPPLLSQPDTEHIPDDVAGFLTEAHHALSIGAYRAVLLLVRSTIEAAAKQKGITDGNLYKKIDGMKAAELIRKGTSEMAHALRILGNDMAHGDIGVVPTKEDAEDALTVLRFVLEDVYVADGMRADLLSRRATAD